MATWRRAGERVLLRWGASVGRGGAEEKPGGRQMAERKEPAVTAFGKPFATTFPQLADALVEWEEEGHTLSGRPMQIRPGLRMSVEEGSFQGTIRCEKPGCAGGGFEVDRIVQSMVQDGAEERRGLLVCGGWRQGAGQQEIPCVNAIRYRIRLTYQKGSDDHRG